MKFSPADIAAMLLAVGQTATLTEPGTAGPPIVADKTTALLVKFSNKSLNELGMLTDKPQVMLDATSMTGVNLKTATLTVSGTTYRMMNPMLDDGGFITLLLQRT